MLNTVFKVESLGSAECFSFSRNTALIVSGNIIDVLLF